MPQLIHKYSEEYRNTVMGIWFRNGKPPITDLVALLEPDPSGHTPEYSIVKSWRKTDSWDTRADELQVAASQKLDIALIDERAEMMVRHAIVGKSLIDKGMEYLETADVKSIKEAVNLIDLGFQIERASRRGKSTLDDIYDKSDKSIMDEIKTLLNRGTTEITINMGDMTEKPEIVEAIENGEIDESSETTTDDG